MPRLVLVARLLERDAAGYTYDGRDRIKTQNAGFGEHDVHLRQ
ncbi:hypothetical protein [Streptomyces sp. NPDC003273]